MGRHNKIETTLDFIVEDSARGRDLLDALGRRGFHVTTPFAGNPDSNQRYTVIRTTPSKARRLAIELTGSQGIETIVGIYEPVRLFRSSPRH